MKIRPFLRLILLLLVACIWAVSVPARADDTTRAQLDTISDTLKQALGDADNPPSVSDQTALVQKALKMTLELPHVFHGQLRMAQGDMRAAIEALKANDEDAAKKAIYDAQDAIRSVM
jgi:hypothetical protein